MVRLPRVLLLFLLVSNTYAAQMTSSPDENSADTNAISGANRAISNGVLSNDALSIHALASIVPSMPKVEPFTFSKRSERPDRFYRASQLAFVGSMMADLGTTWSLSERKVEANPVLGKSKAQQASVSSALALFLLWQAHSLHVRGQTRAAKYLLWMGAAAHVFAVSYNAR